MQAHGASGLVIRRDRLLLATVEDPTQFSQADPWSSVCRCFLDHWDDRDRHPAI